MISYSYKSSGDSIDVYRYIAHSNEYFEEFDDPSVSQSYSLIHVISNVEVVRVAVASYLA